MSRRKSRILVVQSMYSWEFNKQDSETLMSFAWYECEEEERESQLSFSRFLLLGIMENLQVIDEEIQNKLQYWAIDRLGKVELAIMRLATYEMLYREELPCQIIINEAIEIANIFAAPQTFRIINGVLDAIARESRD